jgi:hypothetical protein
VKLLLFAYALAVAFLALWPWNVWLLALGTACACRLQRRQAGSLLSSDAPDPGIKSAKRLDHPLIVRN